MSVSHSSFGADAVNRRLIRSSHVGAFLRFFIPLRGPGQALEAELAHDLPHELLVDDEPLPPPPIQRVLGDPELGYEILDRFPGEHPLTGQPPKLGRIVPWHAWLPSDRAKLSQRWSTIRGQGQNVCATAPATRSTER